KPELTKVSNMKNDMMIEHRSYEALDVMDESAGCNEEGFNGAFDGLHVCDLKALIDESSLDEAKPAVQEKDTKGKQEHIQ
ncbi:MAG: hypothetical protein ACKPKO_55175, partial [Candidatus Fonsibacter sp.]